MVDTDEEDETCGVEDLIYYIYKLMENEQQYLSALKADMIA
jgi:hypothetical protein